MAEVDIAGMVDGALVAGAVEPDGGVAPARDGHCLNCGAALAGAWCQACGQRARVHRTLSAFLHDFFHSLLHFEGKLWTTLPLLAWRPGELTRRYVEGQRVRFVSPIALFLFTVFLMFAALGLNGTISPDVRVPAQGSIEAAVKKQQEAIAELDSDIETARAAGEPVAALERERADEQADLALIRQLADKKTFAKSEVTFGNGVPDAVRDGVLAARENPELALFKVQSKAYKLSWLLIPLSVPFLWLLFPFSRRFRLYDHTVFVTYSLSFMMILASLASVMVFAGAGGAAAFLLALPPLHMYRQLRGAYGLGRAGALVRTLLLLGFALTVTLLFTLAVVGAGLA